MKTTKTDKVVRLRDGLRHYDRVVYTDYFGEFIKFNNGKHYIHAVGKHGLFQAGHYPVVFY